MIKLDSVFCPIHILLVLPWVGKILCSIYRLAQYFPQLMAWLISLCIGLNESNFITNLDQSWIRYSSCGNEVKGHEDYFCASYYDIGVQVRNCYLSLLWKLKVRLHQAWVKDAIRGFFICKLLWYWSLCKLLPPLPWGNCWCINR